jgi:Mg-chelatase subunit ChlD
MTRPGAAALVVLLSAGTIAAQQVYRSSSDVVVIDVAVMDGRRLVADLTQADFELRDNGVVQTILDFDRGRLTLDVTLTIDISGSMTPAKRAALARAIDQVGATLAIDDRVSVVSFGSGVAERLALRHPPMAADLSPRGRSGTSIFDALLLSLVTNPIAGRRSLKILMTDGDETSSVFDERTVRETARFASAQHAFVIVRGRGARADGAVTRLFRDVARDTGGEVLQIDQDEALSAAFLAAIANFRHSYLLRFAPSGPPAAGWHDVSVRVTRGRYTVRARRGYQAPAR